GLPGGGAAEQALVGAIWRQDSGAVARASSRYSPPMQLIGKLYRASGGGWMADWVFVDGGRELASWTTRDGDARRTMAGGADGAADALVKRYAKAAVAGAAGTYRIRISGIRSAADYLRVAAALQAIPVVRAIVPVQASGEQLDLDLELLSGLQGLNRMLGTGSVLQPVLPVGEDELPASAGPAEYRIQ
ncbi:MAG: DUF2066 domain-containing protein, partial [Stenotrophomonas sp.]